jgi:geranylgeranyl diphosphate synthase, type I
MAVPGSLAQKKRQARLGASRHRSAHAECLGSLPPSNIRTRRGPVAETEAAETGAAGTTWHKYLASVEQRLRVLFSEQAVHWSSVDPWLPEAVNGLAGAVLGGGKRLRPLFCAYGFMAAGGSGQPPELIDVAAALELLHAFALIHDDVMDGSPTRRGRRSLHQQLMDQHDIGRYKGEARRFGEGTAVLIGDFGFALAQQLISSAPAAVVVTWHQLCTELVMGQYLDVAGSARGELMATRALTVARYKSGRYTVELPLQLGAALAGQPVSAGTGLFPFAVPLGEAFQLRDDIIAAFGDERKSGKPSGEDLRQGKPTLLLAFGQEMARGAAAAALARAGEPGLSESDVEMMRWALEDCGARQKVESRISALFRRAIKALDGSALPGTVKSGLREVAVRAVWRVA